MSAIIDRMTSICSGYIVASKPDVLRIRKGDLDLEIYDKNNLLGFKLTGNVEGKDIFILHDTDNYNRNDPKFAVMYMDAEKDIKHVTERYLKDEITIKRITEKKLLGSSQSLKVIIPNVAGELLEYKPLTVNATNFFE